VWIVRLAFQLEASGAKAARLFTPPEQQSIVGRAFPMRSPSGAARRAADPHIVESQTPQTPSDDTLQGG
jgi:hypothetical protein